MMETIGHYSKLLSRGEAMALFRRTVEQDLLTYGTDPEAVADIIVALNEAAVNIVRHGYQQPGWVEIGLYREGRSLRIELRDDAPLFNPTSVPAPDITVPLAQRPFGGMGIHMMREFVDELIYEVTGNGRNQLSLIKHHAFPQPE
jgi:serine/threonine-protein kinase RsbW